MDIPFNGDGFVFETESPSAWHSTVALPNFAPGLFPIGRRRYNKKSGLRARHESTVQSFQNITNPIAFKDQGIIGVDPL